MTAEEAAVILFWIVILVWIYKRIKEGGEE